MYKEYLDKLTEQEAAVPEIVASVKSKANRELYLKRLDELDILDDEINEIREDISERTTRISKLESDVQSDTDNIRPTVDRVRNERIEELVKSGLLKLEATKYEISKALVKAEDDKKRALDKAKEDVYKHKEDTDIKIKEEIEQNIVTIKEASNNILGERLARLIDNHLNRNVITLKYTNLEDINERLTYLNEQAVNLDITSAADVDGFIRGLTNKLNFNVGGKWVLLYIIGLAIVTYFFYQVAIPLIFLSLLFVAYLFIKNTSRLFSVRLESKAIEDNMEEVTKARDKEVEFALDQDLAIIENRHNPRIDEYKRNLSMVDSEISQEANKIRMNANPDMSQIISTIQSKIEDKNKEIRELEESVNKLNSKLSDKLRHKKELVDSVSSIVEKTWNNYFNTRLSDSSNPKELTKILPERVPMSKFKDLETNEIGINYFTIPRTNALFIYDKKNYQGILDWCYRFITGIVANTVLGSVLIDINEVRYNAETFRALDNVSDIFRTNGSIKEYKDFCESNLSLINERALQYDKKEKGADKYNWDNLLIEAPNMPYKFLLNFDTNVVEKNILSNESGSSLADIGVYTYNFISVDELKESNFEDILFNLNKYSGTKYTGEQYCTLFNANPEDTRPISISEVLTNLRKMTEKKR